MDLLLYDFQDKRKKLLPLSYIRPISKFRLGIMTIEEKWKWLTGFNVSFHTESYLEKKYKNEFKTGWIVNSCVCPTRRLIDTIKKLDEGVGLFKNSEFIALKANEAFFENSGNGEFPRLDKQVTYEEDLTIIDQVPDVFRFARSEMTADFKLLTADRQSQPVLDPYTRVYNEENVFIEEGVHIKAAILNAETGPIYLGKDSQIYEGAIIRGAFALGEGSHVNPGAKIKGDSIIGPYSKVGGEISNSVIFGYSNKGHDGFLGNSVIGEWCNLGADTNNSNLKNNYTNVKLWDYQTERFKDTGLQFCGLIMGDHSKCGINTMFNTGTMVGVGANIFGSGFPRNFIPSFAWGGANGFSTFRIEKALETAKIVMSRRNVELEDIEKDILTQVYHLSRPFRYWEK
jgi:UDP-N-acetylglucosamine diphosphorylase/glucosamine-1-phosphate N-acetyltransferase